MGGDRGAIVASLCSLALVLVAGVAAAPSGRAADASEGPDHCLKVLERSGTGEAAVKALGADLAASARSVGRSERELRSLLRRDPALRVDRCARLLFVEPAVSGPAAGSSGTASTDADNGSLSSTPPADDAFALSSRPGSTRTIYLDFTGHLLTDTVWNDPTDPLKASIANPPFDIDGLPDTFSSVERAKVKSVWLRVAEDFAPFDVNITTADPGEAALVRADAADQQYGARVVITPDEVMYRTCSCGGRAYVDVFDMVDGGYYQPAFVLQAGSGTSSKSIAELASHEVGHTLGLVHDGTATDSYYAGHGAWAPIMGSGHDRPVTQWSRGEYPGANNTEDDLAVMAGNGLTAVLDDHGGGAGSATAVPVASEVTGVISGRGDNDWFAVALTEGATATVAVRPQTPGADLDLQVDLVDAEGRLITSGAPLTLSTSRDAVSGLGATIVEPLAAGTFFLRVDGVGQGAPPVDGYTDYASLGRYSMSVITTAPLSPAPTPVPEPTPEQTPAPAPSTAPASVLAASPTAAPSTAPLAAAAAPPPSSATASEPAALPSAPQPVAPVTRPVAVELPVTRPVVYAASLRTAVADLPVRREVRSGWSTKAFASTGDARAVRIVPLEEAWASGGRTWTSARRSAFAHDAATVGTLRTASVRGRADRDPADWLPTKNRCGYVAAWTAAKVRWRLAVDRDEAKVLRGLAATCPPTRLTVVRT